MVSPLSVHIHFLSNELSVCDKRFAYFSFSSLEKKVPRATREHSMSFIRMAIHTRARVPAHKYVYTCDAFVYACFGFHSVTRNASVCFHLSL